MNKKELLEAVTKQITTLSAAPVVEPSEDATPVHAE